MRTIITIALNDLRILFANRSVWINLLFVPLVIAYVVGFANGAGNSGSPSAPKLIIDLINQDNGALSQQFITDLSTANPNFVLCPLDNDANDICQLHGAAAGSAPLEEAASVERLKSQTSLALIEIPAGFTDDINAGKDVSIAYRSNEDASAPSYILQAVQAETQRMGGALIAARVGTDVAAKSLNVTDPALTDAIRQRANALWAQNPVQINAVVGQQSATAQSGGGGFKQSIPGIGTMYVLFSLLPAAATIVLQRKNGTLPRLAVLPISRAQILGGKLLANFLIGMMEYAIMFTFGFLLGVRYGSDPLAILLLMITFTLSVTALTLALTALLHNEGQARGIGLFLTLTLCPLGGAWWPLDIVPQFMRVVGHISPVAWVMDGFQSLMFNGGNLGTVMVPILVLLGMTIVFFAFGVSRFKFTD